jgi:hypothetical protein
MTALGGAGWESGCTASVIVPESSGPRHSPGDSSHGDDGGVCETSGVTEEAW